MTEVTSLWHSPDGTHNAVALRVNHQDAFKALEEVDRLGHRLLDRWSAVTITDWDRVAGTVILRRAVTVFVGLRHLLEASVVEVGKLPLRALFEIYVACRYLLYGARRNVSVATPSDRYKREARARYFYVAAERRRFYSRQALLDGIWGHGSIPRRLRARIKKELLEDIADLEKRFPTQTRNFGPLRCFRAPRKPLYTDHHEWYSFRFPKTKLRSVYALATRMGLKNEYEFIYSAASGLMHPRGITHDLKITENGAEVFHAYMAEAFEIVVFFSTSFQMSILSSLARVHQSEATADVEDTYLRVRKFTQNLKPHIPDGYH